MLADRVVSIVRIRGSAASPGAAASRCLASRTLRLCPLLCLTMRSATAQAPFALRPGVAKPPFNAPRYHCNAKQRLRKPTATWPSHRPAANDVEVMRWVR